MRLLFVCLFDLVNAERSSVYGLRIEGYRLSMEADIAIPESETKENHARSVDEVVPLSNGEAVESEEGKGCSGTDQHNGNLEAMFNSSDAETEENAGTSDTKNASPAKVVCYMISCELVKSFGLSDVRP